MGRPLKFVILIGDAAAYDAHSGLDLDPTMIERARANRAGEGYGRLPSFLVGDVASMPFDDGSFDLVVSTLSMHHWADPTVGLAEIGRVLRPGGRALVWDFRPGVWSFHARDLPDPVEHAHGSPLRVVSATPWRWPWRFNLTRRIGLVRADGSPGDSGTWSDISVEAHRLGEGTGPRKPAHAGPRTRAR
ncbi:hypothetical protein BH18ACT11_BH18ACT11_10920 [soil metagenome]